MSNEAYFSSASSSSLLHLILKQIASGNFIDEHWNVIVDRVPKDFVFEDGWSSFIKGLDMSNLILDPQSDSFRALVRLSQTCRFDRILIDGLQVSLDPEVISLIGKLLKQTTHLYFLSLQAQDSVRQSDEVFGQLSSSFLVHNRVLRALDLRGSGVDLMVERSRRNLDLCFEKDMRRWARKLHSLGFRSEFSPMNIFKTIYRQCPSLRSLCIQTSKELSWNHDGGDDIVAKNKRQPEMTMHKLKRLCLRGVHEVSDDQLIHQILPQFPNLEYLNLIGCGVNFENYLYSLPPDLKSLLLEEENCFNVEDFVKIHEFRLGIILKKLPTLKIYLCRSGPPYIGEELDNFQSFRLLRGTQSAMKMAKGKTQMRENEGSFATLTFHQRIHLISETDGQCISL